MSTSTSGPYPGETKADAWLFEHSKFLRKHFSPQGPIDIPSKHELVQERASGDAFPRESKIDAALFEHSKFIRKHIKHEENVNGGIKSKHAMLRESFDGDRSTANGADGAEAEKPRGFRKTMRSDTSNATNLDGDHVGSTTDVFQEDPIIAPVVAASSQYEDRDVINGTDYTKEIPQSGATEDHASDPRAEPTTAPTAVPLVGAAAAAVPAWQAATDNERAYGDATSLRSAAAAATGPGLIEHHPTTMESTPIVVRPVPHSLQSNSEHARFFDVATEFDPTTHSPIEDQVGMQD